MSAVVERPAGPCPPDGATGRPGAGAMVTTDFVACYQCHYRPLVRALRLAGTDPGGAEDVAQEAFARALVHWGRVSRGPNPPGYVYRSAFRLLRRAERRRSRPEHLGSPLATGAPDQDATTTVSVQAALAKMAPRRRQCVVLCLVLGFPAVEAAAVLGITAGTVGKHLDQARRELRAACDPT